MPNIRSSKKDIRRTEARTLRNKANRSKVKTYRKRVIEALAKGDSKGAQEAYNKFASAADKAAKSNAIHDHDRDICGLQNSLEPRPGKGRVKWNVCGSSFEHAQYSNDPIDR